MRWAGPVAAALVAVCLGACDTTGVDPDRPARAEVVGSYEATTLTSGSVAGTVDHLAAGGSVDLTLAADGTTGGRLFVPGASEGTALLDVDLDGTWSYDATTSVATLDMEADTFVRDLALEASRSGSEVLLKATESFSGTEVRIELRKR